MVAVVAVVGDHLVVARLLVAVQAEAVVAGEDASAGHGQNAQDGDETEGHFKDYGRIMGKG